MSATVINAQTPAQARLRREAAKARRRLLPSTILYVGYAMTMLGIGLRSSQRIVATAFFGAGVAAWTLMEYGVHRYILHGRFAPGRGPIKWFAHKYLDPLHWEHHKRPWDGNHINGTLVDTLALALIFAGAASFAPLPTAPMFVAGLMLAYISEEWVHHSVHFYHFRNRYFRYIRRHHLYHHSPIGSEVGYGLTSGFWDVVWKTRIPEADRRALYSYQREALRRLRPPVADTGEARP